MFQKVHREKPESSRSESRESFFVGIKRLAKVDKGKVFDEGWRTKGWNWILIRHITSRCVRHLLRTKLLRRTLLSSMQSVRNIAPPLRSQEARGAQGSMCPARQILLSRTSQTTPPVDARDFPIASQPKTGLLSPLVLGGDNPQVLAKRRESADSLTWQHGTIMDAKPCKSWMTPQEAFTGRDGSTSKWKSRGTCRSNHRFDPLKM